MHLSANFQARGFLAAMAVFTSLASATIPPSDPAIPHTIKATYKVYKAGIWVGTIEEQFSRIGDTYKIVSDTETVGPIRLLLRDQLTLASEGTVNINGLKPNSYQFTRHKQQTRNISSVFDWDKQQIVSNQAGENEVFELPVGTQDRISAMYQFMFSKPQSSEISVWMSQGKKAEIYHYRKRGEPILTIEQESVPTVYYAREAKVGESKAHMWLAKTKYFLPVKIVFEEANGATLEQVLVTLHVE